MSCPSTIDGVANDSAAFAEMESLTQLDLVLVARSASPGNDGQPGEGGEAHGEGAAVEEGEESEKHDLPGQLLCPL